MEFIKYLALAVLIVAAALIGTTVDSPRNHFFYDVIASIALCIVLLIVFNDKKKNS
jgi:hypothetical protein